MTDPVDTWHETMGLSTAAQLRRAYDELAAAREETARTQQALAASQADLTRAKEELHDALRRSADLEQVRADLAEAKALTDIFVQDNQRLEAERAERVDASFALRDERDEARAEAKQWRAQAELYLTQRDDALHDPGCCPVPPRPLPDRGEAVTPAEMIAGVFHATYETLAPQHGYETREASAVAWEDVPEKNRALMIATVQNMLNMGVIVPGPLGRPARLVSDD
jgi:hypothetical protein